MDIPPPPKVCDHEDRYLLCQHAVELAVQDVLTAAVDSG